MKEVDKYKNVAALLCGPNLHPSVNEKRPSAKKIIDWNTFKRVCGCRDCKTCKLTGTECLLKSCSEFKALPEPAETFTREELEILEGAVDFLNKLQGVTHNLRSHNPIPSINLIQKIQLLALEQR